LRLDVLDARGVAMLGAGVLLTWAFGVLMARVVRAHPNDPSKRPSRRAEEPAPPSRGAAAAASSA
jgi:hypothetical protein